MRLLLPSLLLLLTACDPSSQEAVQFHDALVQWKQRVEQANASARQDLYIGRGVADSATAFSIFGEQLALVDSAVQGVQAFHFPGGDSLQQATIAFLQQRRTELTTTLPEKFRTVYHFARRSRGRQLATPELDSLQQRLNALDAEMIRGTETARERFRTAQQAFASEFNIQLPEQQ